MIYLIIASIIWSLSFSLIKGTLTSLDSNFVAFTRLFVSLIAFLPFLKIKNISNKLILHFILIGTIQYGLMYLSYIYSYQFLKAYEIAILTIFTPILVVIIFDVWAKKLNHLHWGTALLAIVGTAIIVYSESTAVGFWKGILLIQLSNLFFALGQVYFKKTMKNEPSINPINIFALLFLGGSIISGIFTFTLTDFSEFAISTKQILTLGYLGVIASGLGFFLWNIGVTKVEEGTLAILNNFKIPLGVIFALIILNESINLIQLSIGTILLLLALYLNEYFSSKTNI